MKNIRPVSDLRNNLFESEVYYKLQEAEREAEATKKRYSSKEVFAAMRKANCDHCSYGEWQKEFR